jgi:radical SAM/Cys-rich protein
MSSLKSLKSQHHKFADSTIQLDLLEGDVQSSLPSFKEKLDSLGFYPLQPLKVEILQVNIGKMCNQTCKHCHVDAGPDRKEIMTRETMKMVIEAAKSDSIHTIDLTGGAPEMNPDFRWFVEQLSLLGKKIIVRCNLTIIVANHAYLDIPKFYRKHRINVVSSLPHFSAIRTDAQRGEGVFEKSIRALRMLNDMGYGKDSSGLELDLVYNPTGAFLPASQYSLEEEFRERLGSKHEVVFNNLFAITNMPISRFLDYLVQSGNYEDYMEKLVNSFNPSAVNGVMCRNTISVGWDGYLYDCDFNQMLDLKVQLKDDQKKHIHNFNEDVLNKRSIVTNQHCFGCTAGAGSSCGGEIA